MADSYFYLHSTWYNAWLMMGTQNFLLNELMMNGWRGEWIDMGWNGKLWPSVKENGVPFQFFLSSLCPWPHHHTSLGLIFSKRNVNCLIRGCSKSQMRYFMWKCPLNYKEPTKEKESNGDLKAFHVVFKGIQIISFSGTITRTLALHKYSKIGPQTQNTKTIKYIGINQPFIF